jgi:pyrroline-5-carboxylate reductase
VSAPSKNAATAQTGESAQSASHPAGTPNLGFIGWSDESAAVFSLLQGRFEGLAESASILAREGERSPLERRIPSVEGLFQTAGVIFASGGRDALDTHLPTIRLAISDSHVLVLLGDGWSLEELLGHLNERKLVRAMVLPVAQGSPGAVAFHLSPYFSEAEAQAFRELFGHLELCIELQQESQIEVLRGLAGFAPAAFYTLLESLIDGVVTMGVPRPAALQYLTALLSGAVGRLLDGEGSPARLREQALEMEVAAAGLVELESAGMRGAVMRSIRKSVEHSREMAARATLRPTQRRTSKEE